MDWNPGMVKGLKLGWRKALPSCMWMPTPNHAFFCPHSVPYALCTRVEQALEKLEAEKIIWLSSSCEQQHQSYWLSSEMAPSRSVVNTS